MGCGTKTVPPIENWVKFQPPDRAYSVLMPAQPQQKDPENSLMKMYICATPLIEVMSMTVQTEFDLATSTPADQEELLSRGIKGGLSNVQGKLIEQQPFRLGDKYPGRDFTASYSFGNVKNGIMRGKTLLLDGQVFLLVVLGEKEVMQLPQVLKCLQSLKIPAS